MDADLIKELLDQNFFTEVIYVAHDKIRFLIEQDIDGETKVFNLKASSYGRTYHYGWVEIQELVNIIDTFDVVSHCAPIKSDYQECATMIYHEFITKP